jgi:hypothetical protein
VLHFELLQRWLTGHAASPAHTVALPHLALLQRWLTPQAASFLHAVAVLHVALLHTPLAVPHDVSLPQTPAVH